MIEIATLPAFSDNFMYVLVDRVSSRAAVVDPGEAAPVARFLAAERLKLTHVLLTHHHADHVGGAAELGQAHGAEVICSTADRARLPVATRAVADGERFELFSSSVEVIATPGHTLGQIAYWLPLERALFTGDTLFSAGCGRVFEGTMEQMWQSLRRLDALPADAQIYFGHEYTLNNLNFVLSNLGLSDQPERLRTDVEGYRDRCRARLDQNQPTTPSRLDVERAVNPFLAARDAAEFTRWRDARNHW